MLSLHVVGMARTPLVTAAWSLGAVLGPGVGGMLVEPADHHPGTFSQEGVFGRYNTCLRVRSWGYISALYCVMVLFWARASEARNCPRLLEYHLDSLERME